MSFMTLSFVNLINPSNATGYASQLIHSGVSVPGTISYLWYVDSVLPGTWINGHVKWELVHSMPLAQNVV